MTLDELNTASRDDAKLALLACGSSMRWADALVARRPFVSLEQLLEMSDAVWHGMGPNDWREAIARHPAIGERSTSNDARARAWSADEQAGAQRADIDTRRRLARASQEYVQRFGHIHIICASGKDADELLEDLRRRMHNTPDRELQVAAEELRKITRLRLEKLLARSAEIQQ